MPINFKEIISFLKFYVQTDDGHAEVSGKGSFDASEYMQCIWVTASFPVHIFFLNFA